MVSDMQQSALLLVVIRADEVIVRFVGHVGRRDRNVFVARDIHARRIIHFVVGAGGDREGRHIAFTVVENGGDIGRKYALMTVSAGDCRIGPPQEMAWRRVAVVNFGTDFQQRFIGKEGKTGHDLQAAHRFHFAHPYGLSAVIVRLYGEIHRHKSGRTVMLRPVKFDTA